jgi:hypothetical protein
MRQGSLEYFDIWAYVAQRINKLCDAERPPDLQTVRGQDLSWRSDKRRDSHVRAAT